MDAGQRGHVDGGALAGAFENGIRVHCTRHRGGGHFTVLNYEDKELERRTIHRPRQ